MKRKQTKSKLATILIVDDDIDFCNKVGEAIKNDYRLKECGLLYSGDGNDALEKYKAYKPDLIVLDMMLPKRSGFLVLERINIEEHEEKKTPVIMVTGNYGTRHKIHAQSLGVSEYLTKPIRMETLRDMISKYIYADK